MYILLAHSLVSTVTSDWFILILNTDIQKEAKQNPRIITIRASPKRSVTSNSV